MSPEYREAHYLPALSANLEEKLFFLPHVNKHTTRYVDFGCGDGSVLQAVAERSLYRNPILIGIDGHTPRHAVKPEVNFISGGPGEIVRDFIREPGGQTTLILSSVLHEMRRLRDLPICGMAPRFIAIRDMCASEANLGAPLRPGVSERLRAMGSRSQWESFRDMWGPVDDWHNATHWVLKSPWACNWNHELHEDYLKLTEEALVGWLRWAGYRVIHNRRFAPQPVMDRCAEYGVYLPNPTHIEIVAEISPQSELVAERCP